jgi:radical SAM superfamily enzyme YgiQ (UPF0313 family)
MHSTRPVRSGAHRNIETIDFDLKADLVGISAMTSYVNRGYEIADQFRAKGVPVVMGGVHPSFMPQEALKHGDAVVIGEVELAIDKLLDVSNRGRCAERISRTRCIRWSGCRCRVTIS